ncbi:MAG: AraC family transcriptional regulator [Pseudomonadales bacterium]|nr:AraC family transcriptional regulator [Pseudomonadales bacterium]NRA16589.1 AraC family transcriptional regulator [Oceanospirillaceae bacterium]
MSQPSNWPLPSGSLRLVVPRTVTNKLAQNPLCGDLYPKASGYYKHAKKHTMLRRVHDDNLLIYCVEGGGNCQLENTSYSINAGDLLLLPRGVAHSYQASDDNPWTVYWIHFGGDKSSDFIEYLNERQDNFIIRVGVNARLIANFEILLESLQSSINFSAFIHASNMLRQILTYIAQLKPLAKAQLVAHQFDLELVHSVMQSSLHQKLDLQTLAQSVNLSKFHFIKKYKELTNSTPINYFIHLKIERACHLLDISTKSIKEISYSLGYEDTYYFSRIFKKVMGISPHQYRQMRDSTFHSITE